MPMWQALAVAVVVAAGAAFLVGRLLADDLDPVRQREIYPGGTSREQSSPDAIPPCKHDWASFDRSICPVDDWMHTYCNDCGRPLDGACGEEYDK